MDRESIWLELDVKLGEISNFIKEWYKLWTVNKYKTPSCLIWFWESSPGKMTSTCQYLTPWAHCISMKDHPHLVTCNFLLSFRGNTSFFSYLYYSSGSNHSFALKSRIGGSLFPSKLVSSSINYFTENCLLNGQNQTFFLVGSIWFSKRKYILTVSRKPGF